MSRPNRLAGDVVLLLKNLVCMTKFDCRLGLTIPVSEVFEVSLMSVGDTGLVRVCRPDGLFVLGGHYEVIMLLVWLVLVFEFKFYGVVQAPLCNSRSIFDFVLSDSNEFKGIFVRVSIISSNAGSGDGHLCCRIEIWRFFTG